MSVPTSHEITSHLDRWSVAGIDTDYDDGEDGEEILECGIPLPTLARWQRTYGRHGDPLTWDPPAWDLVWPYRLRCPEVFIAFYEHTFPLLKRRLRGWGASPEQAEDLAQDALLAIFQFRGHVDTPLSYAVATARHKLYRDCQQNLRRYDAHKAAVDDSEDQPGGLHDTLERVTVLHYLASLPDRQRYVLALRYDGYTPAEIANSLGMTANNVRVTLHHARSRLRARLSRASSDYAT